MDLQAIHVRNFLSVPDVSLDFRGTGATLILGPNGSGKSALFVEPLLWLFYDLLNRTDSKRVGDQVKRRYRRKEVPEDTIVEVWFSHGGRAYYISRSVKDGFFISVDGSNVTPYRNKADGLLKVQEILRLPEELFRAIVIMGQGFTTKFSSFGETDRTAFIEDFIGASIFETALTNAQTAEGLIRAEVSKQQARKEQLSQSISLTTQQRDQFALQKQNADQEVVQRRVVAQTEIQRLNGELQLCQESAVVEGKTYVDICAQLGAAIANDQKARDVVVAANMQLGAANSEVGRLRSSVASRNLSGRCPTCAQPIDLSSLQSLWANEDQQLIVKEQEYFNATASLQNLNLASNAASHELRKLQQAESDLRNAAIRDQAFTLNAKQQLVSLSQALVDLDRYEQTAAANLATAQSRLDQETRELAEVERFMDETSARLPYATWWTEHFSIRGLRGARLGDALGTLNQWLVYYCHELFDGDYLVQLSPVKTQKKGVKSAVTVDVSSPAGSYALSSGGQCRQADLAIHFSLRRLASDSVHGWQCNFLVADEVFDHLDREMTERAVRVLKQEVQRVFVCSHSPHLRSLFQDVWHVRYVDEQTVFQAG